MYGLSKYRYYKEIPLGNVGNALINLKSNEFFVKFPLIKTVGEDSFSLDLFYVSNRSSTKVSFYKGLFCPYERTFVLNTTQKTLQVTKFDGLSKVYNGFSINDSNGIVYQFSDVENHLEYKAYVSPKINDKRFYPVDDQYIMMYDKTSGAISYYKNDSPWPYFIVLNNKQVIRFVHNETSIVINKCNYHLETKSVDNVDEMVVILDKLDNYEITLDKDGKDYYSKIIYRKNDSQLSYVTVVGSVSSVRINYYLNECVKQIEFNRTYYQDRIEYSFSDLDRNILYKFKASLSEQLTEYTETRNNKRCDKITFEYSDDYIYTLDYKGRRELICYNEKGALKTYINKLGYAVNYAYTNEGVISNFNNLLVKEISRPLYINNDSISILKGGFFTNGSFSAFTYNNCSVYAGGYFPYRFVGSMGAKISSDGYLQYTKTPLFVKDKKYTIAFWAKGPGTLVLQYGSEEKNITLTANSTFYTYYYDAEINSNLFIITNESSSDIYVTGIVVYEFGRQLEYSYSYDGRMIEAVDDKKHDYSYLDVNDALVVCNDTDGFSKKTFNSKGLIEEVEYSNNHKVKYEYNNDNRLIKTKNYIDKESPTNVINEKTYQGDMVAEEKFHLYLEHNSNQEVVDYSLVNEYNNNYTLKSVTNSYCINDVNYPGFSEEYDYNGKNQLTKYKVLSSQNEIGYLNNEVNSLKQLDMEYQMTYNDCAQLTKVSLLSNNQSYDLYDYEYYYENSVYTDKLKKKICGDMYYTYTYDSFDQITKIQYYDGSQTKTLANLTYTRGMINQAYNDDSEINYEYDSLGKLIKLTHNDYEYSYIYNEDETLKKIITPNYQMEYLNKKDYKYNLAYMCSVISRMENCYANHHNGNLVNYQYIKNSDGRIKDGRQETRIIIKTANNVSYMMDDELECVVKKTTGGGLFYTVDSAVEGTGGIAFLYNPDYNINTTRKIVEIKRAPGDFDVTVYCNSNKQLEIEYKVNGSTQYAFLHNIVFNDGWNYCGFYFGLTYISYRINNTIGSINVINQNSMVFSNIRFNLATDMTITSYSGRGDLYSLVSVALNNESGLNNIYYEYKYLFEHYGNNKLYYQDLNMKSYQKTGIKIDNDIIIENGFDELNINRYKVYKRNGNIFYAKELLYEKRGNNLALNIEGEVIGKGSSSEQTINYHYDTDGRLKYHSLLGSYSYDGLGRLTSYQYNGTTKTYEYDGYGNITKMGDININYSSNRKDRINTIIKNGVTSNVTYDSFGNMTSYLDRNFTFEGRKLVRVQKDGYYYEYKYDALGNRCQKIKKRNDGEVLSTINYHYCDGLLMDEERDSYTISYIYDENQMLVGFYLIDGDTACKYFYKRDEFQNIIGIVNKNGQNYGNYIYDPWGNLVGEDIFPNNPIRYKGYYYDEETGLYYLTSRYYDSSIGRFISPDSVDYLDPESINGLNLYAYCGNDPVNRWDPTGHLPQWAKWLIGGVAFAGAVALTVLTGGALAPVFIGMGVSIVSGALIQGTINAIQGNDFWQSAADGAADGAMWGGIFALVGASIGAIKYGLSAKGAVNGTQHLTTITKGQQFDRFGRLTGKYITDVGTPATQLALPATNTGVKTTLQATRSFRVITGIVADGFGGTGGGTQYVMRYSIEKLIKMGWLVIV